MLQRQVPAHVETRVAAEVAAARAECDDLERIAQRGHETVQQVDVKRAAQRGQIIDCKSAEFARVPLSPMCSVDEEPKDALSVSINPFN
jgi:hypothetical protein